MQLIQLEYFCTVARCRNMSRASQELCISQPALSKAISNLEDELGVHLFDRVGRGIQLNQSGRLFYHQVSHIMLLLDDAVMNVRNVKKPGKRDVSVLFTAATFIASKIRAEFMHLHPEINLEIKCSYSPDPQDLTDCDIYIFATPFEQVGGMSSIKLMEEPMVIACSKKHDMANKKEVDLIDTAQYMYQCLPPHENMHENFKSACTRAGFEPKISFCTEDSYAFFSGLSSSDLLTMVPGYSGFTSISDDLVLLNIREPKCNRTIYMATHQQRELSKQCMEFQSFCFNFFNNLSQNNVLTPSSK